MMIGRFATILFVLFGVITLAVLATVIVIVFVNRRDSFIHPISVKKDTSPLQSISPSKPNEGTFQLSVPPANVRESIFLEWLVAQASTQTGLNLFEDSMVRDRLLNALRLALEDLKTQNTAQINLPFLAADAQGPKHFAIKLTRSMLDQLS